MSNAPNGNSIRPKLEIDDTCQNNTEALYVTDDVQFGGEVDGHFIDGADGPMQLIQIRLPDTNEMAWVNIVADD